MANQYDTNLKLQAIADAIGDTQSSGLIQALEDIADAVAGGGGGGSSTAGLVSDNFSETDTYDLGDYCIHNNTLYVCINAINTPGPWDLSDWQATNAGLELSSLNSALTKQYTKLCETDLADKVFTNIDWSQYNEFIFDFFLAATVHIHMYTTKQFVTVNTVFRPCYSSAFANIKFLANNELQISIANGGYTGTITAVYAR